MSAFLQFLLVKQDERNCENYNIIYIKPLLHFPLGKISSYKIIKCWLNRRQKKNSPFYVLTKIGQAGFNWHESFEDNIKTEYILELAPDDMKNNRRTGSRQSIH